MSSSTRAPLCTLPTVFQKGKVLCIGMGGGCDIITAYVVAQQFPGLSRQVAWGNTKRPPKCDGDGALNPNANDGNPFGCAPISPEGHVQRVLEHAPLVKGKNYYGTAGIDSSVPTEPLFGSPIIVRMPRPRKGEGRVDEELLKEVASEVAGLGFDAILGVDAGGDSLTGGLDHDGDPSTGVDQMMGRVLCYTGLPFLHLICGLGSDGESSKDMIIESYAAEKRAGNSLGVVSMMGWAPLFQELSDTLEPHRTPNIMARACVRAQQLAAEDTKQVKAGTGLKEGAPTELRCVDIGVEEMVIERGPFRYSIPVDWLSKAFLLVKYLPNAEERE